MPGNKVLLDTNAAIALLDNSQPLIAAIGNYSVRLPYVTLAELYFGAYKSARVAQNLQVVNGFAANSKIIWPSAGAPDLFGKVKATLRAKGRPIPVNDLWIAVIALQENMPVVTRDAHFQYVDGLTSIGW